MAKAEENFKRYRFSVPHADVSINKWVEQQSNLSMSLRMLIGECIEKVGYVDYTCRERIPGARRGRPPKASYESEDIQESEPESAFPKLPKWGSFRSDHRLPYLAQAEAPDLMKQSSSF